MSTGPNMTNFELFEDDSIEDYLDDLSSSPFQNISITGTDWTTETIIRQVEKGNIGLSPIFQRRDAWTPQKKSLFIESIFLGMPIPQLVLAENPEARGKFIVLDGKQRLLSILQFAAENKRDVYKPLKLKGLPILSVLNGKTYQELVDSNAELSNFENHWIRTVIIKGTGSNEMLSQIFYRLNNGSLPLSPQELRFALYPGEFTLFIDEHASSCTAVRYFLRLKDKEKDFRMRDVELFLRLLCNERFMDHYAGNLKKFLDDGFRKFTEDYSQQLSWLESRVDDFDAAHEVIDKAFGSDAYKKWKDGQFESRHNRSLFEVMIYSLRNEHVRQKVMFDDGVKLREGLIELCRSNQRFVDSIEQTTKTNIAVTTRFNSVIEVINDAYGLSEPGIDI